MTTRRSKVSPDTCSIGWRPGPPPWPCRPAWTECRVHAIPFTTQEQPMPIVEPHRDLYVTLRPQAHRKERLAIAAAVLVSTVMGLAAIPCAFVWGVSGLDAG